MAEDNEISKKFKFAKALEGCEEAIEKYMEPPNGVYYRLVHNPFEENDEKPNPVRKWEKMTEEEISLSTTLPKGSDIETQWKHVKDYSPSYNVSEEYLAQFMLGMYDKRKTDKQKESFLRYMGDTIVPISLSPDDGKIQKDPETGDNKGHLVFQPYEDFDLNTHCDWSQAKKLLDYRKNENEEN